MRWTMAMIGLLAAAGADAQERRFFFLGPDAVPASRTYDGDHGFEPGAPALFSVRAAPGNYRVTVIFGGPQASDTTVKAESRRLMVDGLRVAAGRRVTHSFVVNVRDARLAPPPPNAPGLTGVALKPRERGALTWDDRLTLEFVGPRPGVAAVSIAPVAVPTIYLLGDSTVTDQPAEPGASWGQMLTAFVRDDVAIANHAESGETLKSFVMESRLAKVLESVKPGDWVLIQFGHNDQKANWPQTHAPAETTYRDWLRTYIAEFRRRGVTPVLVTSPERRNWNGARIRPTLSDYAAAVRAVGADEGVAVIDLNAASIRLYEALGPERVMLMSSDGGKDVTHFNKYGAWILARSVADGLARLPLAAHLRPLPAFDTARPPAPERFVLAPSARTDRTRPDGS